MLRLHHDSMPTERAFVAWLVRFVHVHRKRSRDHRFPAEPKIDACLTHLAVHALIAAATPHQALHALACLDTRGLHHAIKGRLNAVRADKTIHVPVLMTRAAGAAGRSRIDGPAPLVATRLYGSGVRMLEAVRLRGKDLNDQVQPRTVRSNKGDKDRCTTVPTTWTPLLQNHLAGVKTQHQQDLAQGPGEVDRPYALARQAPHSAMAWG